VEGPAVSVPLLTQSHLSMKDMWTSDSRSPWTGTVRHLSLRQGHSLNQQRKQKRPVPFGPGTSLFRYSDCNLKHPNVGTSGAETNHAPRRVPETGRPNIDRSSIRQSLARRLPGSVMRGLCHLVPVLRADHPRGLNLIRRTVSAPTTVADLIGDLAALHHHFVRGRVVG
jgi:hypothetical protein